MPTWEVITTDETTTFTHEIEADGFLLTHEDQGVALYAVVDENKKLIAFFPFRYLVSVIQLEEEKGEAGEPMEQLDFTR